ncbi:MAG: DUF655 domain-containing protein [Candidatus Bilamarchaeaceae archaeon]
MEEYAWVIEYMPAGHSTDMRRESIVQLLGDQAYTLLEATIRHDAAVVVGQKVFVGKEGRSEVEKIRGRIVYADLTTGAKDIMPTILKSVVKAKEGDFVKFINTCKPISIRSHMLDLLPGIGKKSMEMILEEREKEPFKSFEDIKARIPSIPDPVMMFANRINDELKGNEKYYLFVRPYTPAPPSFRRY